jgi:hypothetical protein
MISENPVSEWVENATLVPPGKRPAEKAGLRKQKERQFGLFRKRSDAAAIVDFLWHYVRNVPRYAATEGEHWALSCLPSTTKTRVTAISLRTMETVVIDDYDAGNTGGFLNVSQHALLDRFGSWDAFESEHPGLLRSTANYRDPGPDQISIEGTLADLHDAVVDDRVGYAIRVLTDRLHRTGQTLQKRGHCPQLADLILEGHPPHCTWTDEPARTPPGTQGPGVVVVYPV